MHDKKIVFQSPLTSRSGYGERARELAKMLSDIYGDDLGLLCEDTWGSTKKINQTPASLRKYLVEHEGNPKVWIHHALPEDFKWNIGKYNIGVTAGPEVDLAPQRWIEYSNGLDLLIVSSEWSKNIMKRPNKNLSLDTPVEVLGESFNSELLENNQDSNISKELDSVITENSTFLSIAEWGDKSMKGSRKAVPELISLYDLIFKDISNRPGLILKLDGFNNGSVERQNIQSHVESIANHTSDSIYTISGKMTWGDMASLYKYKRNIAYLSLNRGEGFGRTMLEAAATGLPVVATGATGQLDYLTPDSAVLIGAESQQIPKGLIGNRYYDRDSNWFEPNWELVSQVLPAIWQNPNKYKERIQKTDTKNIREKFNFNSIKNNLKKILIKYGQLN